MRSVLLALVLLAACGVVNGHGGGLDKYGCHNDRKRGGYHCHRSPAQPSYTPPPQQLYAPPPQVQPSQLSGSVAASPGPRASGPSQLSLLSGADALPIESASSHARTGARVVRGAVWKYTGSDGKVHYTNVRPESGTAKMLFTYVESSGQMWRVVFIADDGTEVAVHSDSVVRKGSFSNGWVLFNYSKARPISEGVVLSQAEKWQINCDLQRISKTDAVSYGGAFASGQVIKSWSGTTSFQGAVPGSSGYAAVRAICVETKGGFEAGQ